MSIGSRLSVRLADFGSRSIITHALMGLGFVGAVISGLFVEGQLGVISMVAFINFTAGLWICQSIHSLGNAATDSEYNGVLLEVLNRV
ncbi:MAG: hypothetical protein ACQET5_15455 [Halobacteriota archaeon]|uniref:hypothetical protein n=1 Tax=Natronomonas sp. TaxID=2184060 RepID=UPI0039764E28